MREMSVTEQRYKAVLAVIADGRTVTEVAKDRRLRQRRFRAALESSIACRSPRAGMQVVGVGIEERASLDG
jgi:hypothetical protein